MFSSSLIGFFNERRAGGRRSTARLDVRARLKSLDRRGGERFGCVLERRRAGASVPGNIRVLTTDAGGYCGIVIRRFGIGIAKRLIATQSAIGGQAKPGAGFRQTLSHVTHAGCVISFLLVLPAFGEALDWKPGSDHRSAILTPPSAGRSGFQRQAPESTGVRFTNVVAESRSLTNHILLNGSGVAAGDIDGDGRCDLYFCGLDGSNALYRNLGNWKFEDVTDAAGVACAGIDATGAVFVDLDGDGDLDLLVSSVRHGLTAFLNNGEGHFRDVTVERGLASTASGTSMTLADVDGDGDLDLYAANYRSTTMRDTFGMRLRIRQVDGRPVITRVNDRPVTDPDLIGRFTIDERGNIIENGEADHFYLNDGAGHFRLVPFVGETFSDEDGRPLTGPLYDWGLTAMFRDLNGDGAPDLYVCNDLGSTDRIWINDGRGRFRAAPRLAFRKTSWFSMGLDCGDLNRDGFDEIFVTDMVSRNHLDRQVQLSDHQMVFLPIGAIENRPRTPRNTLFLNHGDGEYAEIAYFSGIDASEWSWAPVFLDVDLDGYEDILIVTGFERDVQDIDVANRLEAIRRSHNLPDAEALEMRREFPRLALPNLIFRNRGDLTFEEVGAEWGFGTVGISQGIALADLDNDGDLDVIVNNLNAPAGLYRNESSAPRIAIRLRGEPPNTRAVGARIRVDGGPVPNQTQEMIGGGRYLSSDDYLRVFAAGSDPLRIEVRWRSGKQSVITNATANRIYEIDERHALPSPAPAAAPAPLFVDVSHLLDHTHVEEAFDDFARQPLLPRKLSQLGPGIAWSDLDGDGHEDLIVGSGKGGQLAAFRNNGQGGFALLTNAAFSRRVTRDQSGVLGWPRAMGHASILAASSNYEDGLALGTGLTRYHPQTAQIDELWPSQSWSIGPLALADVDADGDLDLFVGGRAVPGRYPEAASSRLFRNENGRLVEDAAHTKLWTNIGMVSGAVFSDLDGDGFPELILACDWGPLRIFRRSQGGDYTEITRALGLEPYRGWWNGVTTGDFDGDGRMDIVASNWGRNSRYQRHRQQPLRLYYGDFNGTGDVDLLEAHYEPPMDKYVPYQHWGRVASALPYLVPRFESFRQFAEAGIAEILQDRGGVVRVLEANWLETTLFLNRGDRFEAHPLPMPAQWTPAFALCVGDVDGDGNEDLFLSQNFFATEPETGRYDSGRGLWLRGDGRGVLDPLPSSISGIRVHGEQRGAAVCDYDGDGRLDLVVTQNGARTLLFRNQGAAPGLRVRLRGPPGNPTGVGANIRLHFGERIGPAREIHAGSGYWSQDSAIQIFGTPQTPTRIEVRWPGGNAHTSPLPEGVRDCEVDAAGNVRPIY
jgi:enediyne biosynthesis protein E4